MKQESDWMLLVILCLINLLCAIDGTVLSTAIPAIATNIHGSSLQAFWCGTSFALASTVVQSLCISLSEIVGHASLVLCTLAVFALGSSLAMMAEDVPLFLLSRTVQGLGAGGLTAATNMLVFERAQLRRGAKWLGAINLCRATGSILGPAIGGSFTQYASWRWTFWLNMPVCVTAFLAVPFVIPQGRPEHVRHRLGALDWLGAIQFVVCLAGSLIPLTWGGVLYAWWSLYTLVPLTASILGFVVFAFYSALTARPPFLGTSLFANTTSVAAYVGAVVHGIAVSCLCDYLSLYFEIVQGASAASAGTAILTFLLTVGPAAALTGVLVAKTGGYRVYLWAGWTLLSTGVGLLALLREGTSFAIWFVLSSIGGLGLGILFSTQGFAAQASATDANRARASAMATFFRSLGQTVGAALGGAAIQNMFAHEIQRSSEWARYATAWANNMSGVLQALKTLTAPKDQALRDTLVQAYVVSLQVLWVVLCGISAATLLVSVAWTKDLTLHDPADLSMSPGLGRRKHHVHVGAQPKTTSKYTRVRPR